MAARALPAAALIAAASLPAAGGEPVSYARQIQPIFNVTCLQCHFGGVAIGDLDLGPAVSYESLVGVWSTQADMPRVDPGDPDNSYLMHKLQNTHRAIGGRGEAMPMVATRQPLARRQLELIREWITLGARDN